MEKHCSQAARGLIVCAVLAVLLVAAVPMYFAHPLADDLGRWRHGADEGWFQVAYQNYKVWTGRWSAMALAGGLLPWLDGHRYGIALGGLATIQLFACYAFVRLVLANSVTRLASCGLAMCFYALYWVGMPRPGETVYWISGCLEYQLSISLITILVWLAATVRPKSTVLLLAWIATLSGVALLITGLHELAALMLVLTMAAAAAISYRTGSKHFPVWSVLLLVAVAGLLLNGFAPGNAARAAHFENARSVPRAILLTAKFLLRDVSVWLADPRLMAASLFLLLSPWFTRLRPAWLLRTEIAWRWILPGMCLCFLALGAAAPGYATAASPPGRAENMLYFVFLLAWFATLLVISRWPENWILRREPPAPMLQTAALAVLGISLLASGNTHVALRDLDKRIGPWHQAMLQREQIARAAEPKSDLVVPQMPDTPHIFFTNDICDDPQDWRNALYAHFHGLSSVRIETALDRAQREAASARPPLR